MSQPEPQYAVQITFYGRDVDTSRPTTLFDAVVRARLADGQHGQTAIVVTRTPGRWRNELTLPDLGEGASIEWGVTTTWPDGYSETEPVRSRSEATRQAPRTRPPGYDLLHVVVWRLLPAWVPWPAGGVDLDDQ